MLSGDTRCSSLEQALDDCGAGIVKLVDRHWVRRGRQVRLGHCSPLSIRLDSREREQVRTGGRPLTGRPSLGACSMLRWFTPGCPLKGHNACYSASSRPSNPVRAITYLKRLCGQESETVPDAGVATAGTSSPPLSARSLEQPTARLRLITVPGADPVRQRLAKEPRLCLLVILSRQQLSPERVPRRWPGRQRQHLAPANQPQPPSNLTKRRNLA
jgi:hypothetical protein